MTPSLLLLLVAACTGPQREPVSGPDTVQLDKGDAHAQPSKDKGSSGQLQAVINVPEDQEGLIQALAETATAPAAVQKLVAMGDSAVPALRDTAMFGEDTSARGRAIEALTQIPGTEADKALQGIQSFGQAPELVRTWAAAGLIARTQTMEELLALAPLANQFPALGRPIKLRVEALTQGTTDVGAALLAVSMNPELAPALADTIMGQGVSPLMDAMLHHSDMNVRRMAAGYLGNMGQNAKDAPGEIARGYAYTPGASEVLWQGGPLYVPGLNWKKKDATNLVGHLVSWHLYCDLNGLVQEKQQIYNNLQSVNLHRPAGMDWPNQDTNALLVQYGKAAGKPALEKILAEHGVKDQAKYQKLLSQVK